MTLRGTPIEEHIVSSLIAETDPHAARAIQNETTDGEDDEQSFTLEDAESQLHADIEDARNFINSDLQGEWEKAQRYYNGETSLPSVEGRSKVVATKVSNAIRGSRPSLLRIFLSTSAVVEFQPTASHNSDLAHQQSLYCNNLFWRCGGYRVIYDVIQNASLKKIAPVKWWHEDITVPQVHKFTRLPEHEYEALVAIPEVSVIEAEAYDEPFLDQNTGQESFVTFYDCEILYSKPGGQIKLSTIPLFEFFISKNAKSVHDARVIGHTRNMTVGEVVRMGISEADLDGLDAEDQESARGAGESEARRGYVVEDNQPTDDPSMREVLITECYARFDLEGRGHAQLYKFILGGTSHKMLQHEQIDEVPIEVICIDFEPDTVIGRSLYDVLHQDQDVSTSLLRATVDNAHAANNTRLAVHESLVNLGDVMSPQIGHPIRFRAPGMLQEIKVQSSAGAMLPLMQYLDAQSDNKAGVTQAAMGLDPDALQSTEKEAVKNTIVLSQGQVEVMARNIAEGLRRVFAGILKLSMRHYPRYELIQLQGAQIPVDQAAFDPSLHMEPNVGIGTGNTEQKMGALQFALGQQQQAISTLGPVNPFCDFSHVYNTLEDILKLMGVHNIGRYFRNVTPDMGQQFAEQMAQQMAEAEEKKIDPQEAYLQAEALKAQTNQRIKQMELIGQQRLEALKQQYDALVAAAKDDLERDRLDQQKHLEVARIVGQYAVKPNLDAINRDKDKPREFGN